MKLQYLGTAASEGWPALFCQCEHCARARAAGGRNIRTRSQALIDDVLAIDFPADTYMHILTHRLDASKWAAVLITHAHSDHFYPSDFVMRRPPFAHGAVPLTVYCNRQAAFMAQNIDLQMQLHHGEVEFRIVDAFVPFRHGRYEITPLRADHDETQDAYIYLISDGDKTLLYAHDTGYFPDETWAYLRGRQIDCISLDCTYGVLPTQRNGHMSIDVCAEVAQRLAKDGRIPATAQLILNHFSHNGLLIYDELVPKAAELGFTVSYDGLTIKI